MRQAFPEATVVGYEPLIASMKNSPEDRHVAAAAVSIGAQLIVTSNLRDFSAAALERFNLKAQSPDDFLQMLLDMEPEEMILVIERMSAARRTPAASAGGCRGVRRPGEPRAPVPRLPAPAART